MSKKRQKGQSVAISSPDMVAERMEQLRQLFPDALSEGKMDFEKLRAALGDIADDRPERYSFTWAGKRDAIRLLQTPSRATLVPCPDESVNFDSTRNLFIEGDNLEVLKLLYKSYAGRVKMIYIDPPYNTGNDFIYPDNFADPLDTYLKISGQKDDNGNLLTSNPETSGRYHSAWLSMIYPRLFVARQLLRDDGLLFVSIDDREVYNLRILLNEVFGEENFIAQFVWDSEGHTDNQYDVKVNHEYVLLYARNASRVSLGHVVDPNTRQESNLWKGFAANSITKNGPGNPPSKVVLPVGFPCEVDSLDLPASEVDSEFWKEVDEHGYISRPITSKFSVTYPIRLNRMLCRGAWLTSECEVFSGWANVNKLKAFIANGCRPIEDDEGNPIAFYLSDRGVIYYRKERESARNILSVLRRMGTTEQMRSELEEMGILFQYPKPATLLEHLIRIGADTSGILMDFFAGSCTFAHAVLNINHQDGGNRRFIMVQLQEPTPDGSPARKAGFKTIAEIGKERIRRVIKKMKKEAKGKLDLKDRDEPEDLGFCVFKLAESHFRRWTGTEEKDPKEWAKQMELFVDPLLPGWEILNIIHEVALKEGYSLTSRVEPLPAKEVKTNSVYRVTDDDRGQSFLICLDDKLKAATPKALGLKKDDTFICRDVALTDEVAANLALQCRLKTI